MSFFRSLGFAGLLVLVFGGLLVGAAPRRVVVITHDSFDLDKKLVQAWEAQNGAKLEFVRGGDAGAMLSKLILTKNAPIADAVYGLDNTLAERAFRAEILEPYQSKTAVPKPYVLDTKHRLTSVNYGFVALNYDTAWFAAQNLGLPQTLGDLTRPAYKDLLVVQNPATSSPGLAFLLATYKAFGPDQYLRFWRALRDNGVRVSGGWDNAYNVEFSKNKGPRPIVVSYASSPAAEMFYADPKPTQAPTANLLLPNSSFLQIEGVGVLRGTKQRDLARRFVDFMLSASVQRDIPTRMWVYPVVPNTPLDASFAFAQIPTGAQTARLANSTMLQSDALVANWNRVVLQNQDPATLK